MGEREGEVEKKGAGYGDWAQREVEVCVARVRVCERETVYMV